MLDSFRSAQSSNTSFSSDLLHFDCDFSFLGEPFFYLISLYLLSFTLLCWLRIYFLLIILFQFINPCKIYNVVEKKQLIWTRSTEKLSSTEELIKLKMFSNFIYKKMKNKSFHSEIKDYKKTNKLFFWIMWFLALKHNMEICICITVLLS